MNYTPEMRAFLESYIPGHHHWETAAEFEKRFGIPRNINQMNTYAKNHKIKTGLTGRFEKGNIPKNKGKTWDEYMTKEQQEKARVTQFKKGSRPHNYVPVGSEALTTGDQYVKVKIAEPNVWEFKHILTWKKYHGEIPQDMAIVFRDGNRQNCSIDNLRMIPKAALTNLGKFSETTGKARDVAITLSELKTNIRNRRQQDGNNKR